MMSNSFSAYTLLLLVSTVIGILVALEAWKRRSMPGGLPLVLFMASVAIWSVALAVESMMLSLPDKILWSKIQYLGVSGAPVFFFAFILEFSISKRWLFGKVSLLFLLEPLLLLAMAWTNEWHHLIWSGFIPIYGTNQVIYQHGLVFWVHVIISYSLVTISLFMLGRNFVTVRNIFRKQNFMLVLAVLLPWFGNIIYLLNIEGLQGYDLTAFGFAFSGIILYYAFYRLMLFDFAPVVRDAVVEQLNDGFLVVDENDRLLDINPSACRLFSLSNTNLIGQNISRVFAGQPELLEFLHNARAGQTEISLGLNMGKELRINSVELCDWRGHVRAMQYIFSDISIYRQAENILRQNEERYRMMVDDAPFPVVIIRLRDNMLTYMNLRALDLFELTPEAYHNVSTIPFYADQLAREEMRQELARQGCLVDYEARLLTARKKEFWALITANLIDYESEPSVFVSFNNITLRKFYEDEEHKQRIFAEALANTASGLNSTLNFDELLGRILDNVGKVVPHDCANIILIDENKDIRVARARGYEKKGTQERVMAARVSLDAVPYFQEMVESQLPVVVPNTMQNDKWTWVDGNDWIRSYVGAPIIIKGKVAGILSLDCAQPNFFTGEDAGKLRIFADQAAIAIENSKLFEDTGRFAREMATVNRIALAITYGFDLPTMFHTLHEQCQQVLPSDRYVIVAFNDAGGLDTSLVFDGERYHTVDEEELAKNLGFFEYVMELRQTVYLPDVQKKEPGIPPIPDRCGLRRARSILTVPLIQRDRVLGILLLGSLRANAYAPDQRRLLETIAIVATIAIENSRLFAGMQKMATTDALTNLYNRRQFEILAFTEIDRATRYHHPLSALMVDIDRFKTINDTYGHGIGDVVIKSLADKIQNVIRKVDVVCRWGGEEFVVILPETNRRQAVLAAERLRRAVESQPYVTPEGEIPITVSIGVAEMEASNPHLASLVDCADQAMYWAKQGGRNQVKVYDRENAQNGLSPS